VKFHLILLPSRPPLASLSHAKSGWASSPLTSTLAKSGKVTPKFFSQKSEISASSPGSWLPNWSQGKPSTTRPWSA